MGSEHTTDEQLECVIDLQNRAEEYGIFELGVHHLIPTTDDGEEKILVGVDTLQDECVKIVEGWHSEWEDSLESIDSEYMDDNPHFLVYEFRPV